MKTRSVAVLVMSAVLVACPGSAPPGPSASGTATVVVSSTPSASVTPATVSRATIWISPTDRTVAAFPPSPGAAPRAPGVTQYRIEGNKTGYEAVELLSGTEGRRVSVPDAEVDKLVALARSLQPVMCPGQHSTHNDPELHFRSDQVNVDALGGIALGCQPGDSKCESCRESFEKLHRAVLDVVTHALPPR